MVVLRGVGAAAAAVVAVAAKVRSLIRGNSSQSLQPEQTALAGAAAVVVAAVSPVSLSSFLRCLLLDLY